MSVLDGDAVDIDIEVRSGAVFGFVEVAVLDNLGILFEVCVGINVSLVGIKLLAADGEGIGVEDVKLAGDDIGLCGIDRFLGARCGDRSIELGELYAVVFEVAEEFFGDGGAVHNGVGNVNKVRSPVDLGGDKSGLRALIGGAAVIGNVGNALFFASGGSAPGIGVLADKDAAVVDKRVGVFLFLCFIVPGGSEHYFHGDRGANGLCAKVEGGVAGFNFRIRHSADITHFCLLCGDLAVLNHFVELETGDDTGKVSAFINGGESIVEVGNFRGVRLGAGSVAELHVRVFHGGAHHEIFMTEGIGKDNIAAFFGKLHSGGLAGIGFGNVGLDKNLFVLQTKLLLHSLCSIDEVLVIGGIFIVEADDTDFEIVLAYGRIGNIGDRGGAVGILAAGSGAAAGVGVFTACKAENREHHKCRRKERKDLL